jgi:hypothetical protein
MRHILTLLLASLLFQTPAFAQIGFNAPAGQTPRQDVEIYTRNGFLVQRKYSFTTDDPNANVNTLSCTASPPSLNAPAGVLLDPGGMGDYHPASFSCSRLIGNIPSPNVAGFEIVFDDLDTEAGIDSVRITDANNKTFFAFSGQTLPSPFFVAGTVFKVTFFSDFNATVGRGFRLRWRAVYFDPTPSKTPNTAFGTALLFDVQKGALLGGDLGTGALEKAGRFSTSLGSQNTASGPYSTALGVANTAIGYGSTAIGVFNNAGAPGGPLSFFSAALGWRNTASGRASLAMGLSNTANGPYSTAIGAGISTAGFDGSMALGDALPDVVNDVPGIPVPDIPTVRVVTGSTAQNQLTARFRGGFRFISDYNTLTGAVNAGAILAPGGNSWAAISDSTKKERFQLLNHKEVLGKLGSLRLGSWNYKGQPGQRHYGPMAQDFFARFGHDGIGTIGCDTLLAGHDFTAITLVGVQALIKENEQLKAKIAQMENQTNARLEQANARLEALEALLPVRRRNSTVTKK